MTTVSRDIVESTWRRMASMSSDDAVALSVRWQRHQPEVLAYVLASVSELKRDPQELAVYLAHNVLEMFEVATRPRIGLIKPGRLRRIVERRLDLIEGLDGADPRFLERVAAGDAERQPHLMRYLLEALLEPEPDVDPVPLNEDDVGTIYLTLSNVVIALDEAVTKAERGF